jgi:hypothetical protein
MKGKIVQSLHHMSIVLLVMVLVIAFQPSVFGQDLSATQDEIWKMVESYWSVRKENTPTEIIPFYHDHYIHWGAVAGVPLSYSSMAPPSGQTDALKGAIDSFELVRGKFRTYNNFAIAMYHNKVVYLGRTYRLRCTDVWMKESNKWQLVATVRDFCNVLPDCPRGMD